jgi:hypothetical protein
MNNTTYNRTNTFNSADLLTAMKTKRGQFFRLNLTRKSGNKASFVCKFRKASKLSVTVHNAHNHAEVNIPFSAIRTYSIS